MTGEAHLEFAILGAMLLYVGDCDIYNRPDVLDSRPINKLSFT